MDVFTALGLVTLGGLLGAVGQGMRVIVGIKKDWEEAAKSERIKDLTEREKKLHEKIKELDEEISEAKGRDAKEEGLIEEIKKKIAEKELLMKDKEMVLKQRQALGWFSWNELLTSLIIALVVGAIAGILAGITLPTLEIDMRAMLSIIAAGYAGTDFIEGFMKPRMPK